MTKEAGRPKIEIDFKVLDALVQFKVTKGFVADYLKVSEDTIEKRIREHADMTYTEYCKLKQQNVSYKLQQKTIELALAGDRTLMIFALKNMSGWSDKTETSHELGNEAKKLVINLG